MKRKAQSLLEFSIILVVVSLIAVVSVQFINKKINTTEQQTEYSEQSEQSSEGDYKMSQDEKNCIQMGLNWDAQNSVCEPK